jgi:hypothetical protein
MEFSGICSISLGMTTGTLVLQNGRSILAGFKNKSGDAAWEELVKISDNDIDASLSSLEETQVQLALEFNKTSWIQKSGPAMPPFPLPVPRVSSEKHAGEKEKGGSGDAEKCSDPDIFENDIATLDRINVEEMTEKMRKDCKTMIKDLNLEHLIKR